MNRYEKEDYEEEDYEKENNHLYSGFKMKRLFGNVYFLKPFFIGIKLNNKKAVIILNTILAFLMVYLIYLILN